jgi:hypothetical protein
MAYTKTTWVNGSAPAINATNLNKIEQGIADAGPALIQTLTADDMTLYTTGNPDTDNNWFIFDLTGVPTPANGYRLKGIYAHSADFVMADDNMQIDCNQAFADPINDPWTNQWDWRGKSLTQAATATTMDNINTKMAFDGNELAAIRLFTFTQDLIPTQLEGKDFVIGDGVWQMHNTVDNSNVVSRTSKAHRTTTSDLDGSLRSIIYYNQITLGGSYDLKNNPIDTLEISLYAF